MPQHGPDQVKMMNQDSPHEQPIPPPLARLYPSKVPAPRILSWNVNGLSAYSDSSAASKRSDNIWKNIYSQATHHDFILLQETHLGPDDLLSIGKHLRSWKVFHNSLSTISAGIAILVSPHIHPHLTITQYCIQGHVQILSISPTDTLWSSFPPFTIGNFYLYSGAFSTNTQARLNQLTRITSRCSPPPQYSFFAGDWNSIIDPEDSSSSQHHSLRPSSTEAFHSFSSHFSLSEAHQPTHTFIRKSSPPITSRLDRFYHSLSPADLALVSLQTSIASVPYPPLHPPLSGP